MIRGMFIRISRVTNVLSTFEFSVLVGPTVKCFPKNEQIDPKILAVYSNLPENRSVLT